MYEQHAWLQRWDVRYTAVPIALLGAWFGSVGWAVLTLAVGDLIR